MSYQLAAQSCMKPVIKSGCNQKRYHMQLFQNISINDNLLKYQAYTASGELFDSFLLKKQKNGKNKMIDQKPNRY